MSDAWSEPDDVNEATTAALIASVLELLLRVAQAMAPVMAAARTRTATRGRTRFGVPPSPDSEDALAVSAMRDPTTLLLPPPKRRRAGKPALLGVLCVRCCYYECALV